MHGLLPFLPDLASRGRLKSASKMRQVHVAQFSGTGFRVWGLRV